MVKKVFNSTDFGAIASLTDVQLTDSVRDSPEEVLSNLCKKLDSLRADRIKALTIQNMYRSEEWRAIQWYLGQNEALIPASERTSLSPHRAQRLRFVKEGIGLSEAWENRITAITAKLEALYPCWAALVEKTSPSQLEDVVGCTTLAQAIIGEHRWLRDQEQIASVSMAVLGRHRGVEGLNCVIDGGGELASRSGRAGFTWVSFR